MAFSYCPYCARELKEDQVCTHCGKTPESYEPLPHHFPAGTVLDKRYWMGRVLGEGGFGITYLGFDAKLERRVAIKEYFPTSMVSRTNGSTQVVCYTREREQFDKGREQFLKEARTLAKVDNIPEIVRVMDYFPANGTAYIVMEFLEGETLKSFLKRNGRIAPRDMFAMMDPLMKALDRVHKTGLIHRDISPDNIMLLTETDEIKLMDFGCARDASSGMTMTVMLKPGFAPFEQYSGSEQGPWTDVYALCATMYHAITGKLPPNAMVRTEADTLQPPSAHGIAISPEQESALMKGLSIWKNDRWKTVGELRKALMGELAERDTPFTLPKNSEPAATPEDGFEEVVSMKLDDSVEESNAPTAAIPRSSQPAMDYVEVKSMQLDSSVEEANTPTTAIPRSTQSQPVFVEVESIHLAGDVEEANSPTAAIPVSREPKPAKDEKNKQTTPAESDQPKTKGKGLKPKGILAIAAAIAAVVILAVFGGGILRNQFAFREKIWHPGSNTGSVFHTSIEADQVGSVTFLDSLEDAPFNAIVCLDEKGDTVKVWKERNDGLYDVYIAAEGGVHAPRNSSYMFHGMTQLHTIRFSDSFYTDAVENMSYMFCNCHNLIQLDVSGFNTANVTTMAYMFEKCNSLVSLDLSGFDTGNVEHMKYMFYHCSGLTGLDLSGFDTSSVVNMRGMFQGCTGITTLDLSGFDTGSVTKMSFMFDGCSSLTAVDVSSFDTRAVTDMDYMFSDCPALVQLDISSFDTSSVTNLLGMFDNTTGLTDVTIGNFNVTNVIKYEYFMAEDGTVNGRPWESYFE